VSSEDSQPPLEDGSAAEGDSFDVWLRHHLHRSYGATMAEPIPEELLRLIEEGGNTSPFCARPVLTAGESEDSLD